MIISNLDKVVNPQLHQPITKEVIHQEFLYQISDSNLEPFSGEGSVNFDEWIAQFDSLLRTRGKLEDEQKIAYLHLNLRKFALSVFNKLTPIDKATYEACKARLRVYFVNNRSTVAAQRALDRAYQQEYESVLIFVDRLTNLLKQAHPNLNPNEIKIRLEELLPLRLSNDIRYHLRIRTTPRNLDETIADAIHYEDLGNLMDDFNVASVVKGLKHLSTNEKELRIKETQNNEPRLANVDSEDESKYFKNNRNLRAKSPDYRKARQEQGNPYSQPYRTRSPHYPSSTQDTKPRYYNNHNRQRSVSHERYRDNPYSIQRSPSREKYENNRYSRQPFSRDRYEENRYPRQRSPSYDRYETNRYTRQRSLSRDRHRDNRYRTPSPYSRARNEYFDNRERENRKNYYQNLNKPFRSDSRDRRNSQERRSRSQDKTPKPQQTTQDKN